MEFYKKVYTTESTVKNKRRIIWKLRHHKKMINTYVITLAGGSDMLEIYHSAFLDQTFYRKNPPFIIGLASGYDDAVRLVRIIIEEVLQETGDCDVKKYIEGQRI